MEKAFCWVPKTANISIKLVKSLYPFVFPFFPLSSRKKKLHIFVRLLGDFDRLPGGCEQSLVHSLGSGSDQINV